MDLRALQPSSPAHDAVGGPGILAPAAAQRQRMLLRDAARGLYCQMYYWGLDVRHPGGSLLVGRGLTRIPKTTARGTSRYRMPWQDGHIELHGFYAGWYGPGGGILFHRPQDTWLAWPDAEPPYPCSLTFASAFNHKRPGAAPAANSQHAPRTNLSAMLERAAKFIQWVHEYESWAQTRWAPDERRRHHQDFLKLIPRRWWLPPDHSLRWFRQFADNPANALRPKELQALSDASPCLLPLPPRQTAATAAV